MKVAPERVDDRIDTEQTLYRLMWWRGVHCRIHSCQWVLQPVCPTLVTPNRRQSKMAALGNFLNVSECLCKRI